MKTSGLRLGPVGLKCEEAVTACSQGVRLVPVELGVKKPDLKTGPCGLEVRRGYYRMQSGRKTGPCGFEGRRRQVLKLVPVDLKGEDVRS